MRDETIKSFCRGMNQWDSRSVGQWVSSVIGKRSNESLTMVPRPHPETDVNQHKRFAQHIGPPRRGAPGRRRQVIFITVMLVIIHLLGIPGVILASGSIKDRCKKALSLDITSYEARQTIILLIREIKAQENLYLKSSSYIDLRRCYEELQVKLGDYYFKEEDYPGARACYIEASRYSTHGYAKIIETIDRKILETGLYKEIFTKGRQGYQKFLRYPRNKKDTWNHFRNIIKKFYKDNRLGNVLACSQFWQKLQGDDLFAVDSQARAEKMEIVNIFDKAVKDYKSGLEQRMAFLQPIDIVSGDPPGRIILHTNDRHLAVKVEKYADMYKNIRSLVLPGKDDVKPLQSLLQEIDANHPMDTRTKTLMKDFITRWETYHQIWDGTTYTQKEAACRRKCRQLEAIKTLARQIYVLGIFQKLPEIEGKIRQQKDKLIQLQGIVKKIKQITPKKYIQYLKNQKDAKFLTEAQLELYNNYPHLPPVNHLQYLKRMNAKGYWEAEFDSHLMVYIPGTLDGKGNFWVDKYEVSYAQLERLPSFLGTLINSNGKLNNRLTLSHPALVTFEQAEEYCQAKGFRLLTIEEWEIAAGKDHGYIYPWGNQDVDANGISRANYISLKDGNDLMAPAKSYDGNDCVSPFGIVNLAGNVWEWVKGRICKGGGFMSEKQELRITSSSTAEKWVGFRCARDVEPKSTINFASGGQKPFREKVSGLPKAFHWDGLDTLFFFVSLCITIIQLFVFFARIFWHATGHQFITVLLRQKFSPYFFINLCNLRNLWFHFFWLRPQAAPGNFVAKNRR